MTQKLLCLCATAALLFVFATTNVASAQDAAAPEPSAPVACPCEFAPAGVPCRWGCCTAPWLAKGCQPVVSYRIGLLGCIRPVVYAPVYRPVCVPPPRFVAPYPCAVPCAVPVRAVYAPYCW